MSKRQLGRIPLPLDRGVYFAPSSARRVRQGAGRPHRYGVGEGGQKGNGTIVVHDQRAKCHVCIRTMAVVACRAPLMDCSHPNAPWLHHQFFPMGLSHCAF